MNATPFIPPLEPRHVRALLRELRVLRHDYPGLSDEELAEEWAARQRALMADGRDVAYAEWMESDRFLHGFRKALAAAARDQAQKDYARAQRRRIKEARLDKEPATPRQQRFVTRLAERRHLTLDIPPAALSKLAASRLIERLLESPPPGP